MAATTTQKTTAHNSIVDRLQKTAKEAADQARKVVEPIHMTKLQVQQALENGGVANGQPLSISITKIHDNEDNAHFDYDPEIIQEYAVSISTEGQIEPALVIPHPEQEGDYLLVAGHYRKRALLSLGRTEMNCIIDTGGQGKSVLDLYRRGWHVHSLLTPEALAELAGGHGLQLVENRLLSPYLRLQAIPDLPARALSRLFRPAWGLHPIVPSMLGSTALQKCLRNGTVEYRWMVLERAAGSAGHAG